MLALIGTTLCPHPRDRDVDLRWLYYLRDLEDTGSYCWGAVTLAYNYNALTKYANKKLKVLKLTKRSGDMVKIIADNNNLKKFIIWKPKYQKLSTIVKSCIQWEKKLTGKF